MIAVHSATGLKIRLIERTREIEERNLRGETFKAVVERWYETDAGQTVIFRNGRAIVATDIGTVELRIPPDYEVSGFVSAAGD